VLAQLAGLAGPDLPGIEDVAGLDDDHIEALGLTVVAQWLHRRAEGRGRHHNPPARRSILGLHRACARQQQPN
jgi:hypothetical protein